MMNPETTSKGTRKMDVLTTDETTIKNIGIFPVNFFFLCTSRTVKWLIDVDTILDESDTERALVPYSEGSTADLDLNLPKKKINHVTDIRS